LMKALGGSALLGVASTHCGGSSKGHDLAPVRVSEDRIIRTTVGLRPFRPSGFRVESETMGDKTIVHNYGHGGGGMSLSWGSSHLAVEKAIQSGSTRYAVIGCGVMGLSTSRLLQGLGLDVTIYAREINPFTTSNMSAAWWSPGSTVDPQERTPEYNQQFEAAARWAHRYYQNFLGDDYGVHFRERYSVSETPPDEERREGPTTQDLIGDLFPETQDLAAGEHPFPWPYVRRSWTMVIEPPRYLRALLRDYRLAGGDVVVREFTSLDEVLALEEPVILNCSGLGSRDLFGDETMTPIKGQLTVLLPQPQVRYMMVGGGLYMIPRGDGIVLGGTHERGEWSLEPSRTEMNRVMNGHMEFWSRMA
jgi:D-amino-acid oxidase